MSKKNDGAGLVHLQRGAEPVIAWGDEETLMKRLG
jgi:hypothetical protein